MKVDTRSMEDAYFKLRELHYRLEHIQCQVEQIQSVLRWYRVGGAVITERITDSLGHQLRAMERRADALSALAGAIRAATNEYQECENLNRNQASYDNQFPDRAFNVWTIPDYCILPLREKEIINQYIMPLITAGK